MSVGKLAFADPTDLFEHLKSNSSNIFVAGVQNDFHQIFTLLIDKLSDSYKEVSPDQAKFISKLLFGKMNTKIDFIEVITFPFREKPIRLQPLILLILRQRKGLLKNHSKNGNTTKLMGIRHQR